MKSYRLFWLALALLLLCNTWILASVFYNRMILDSSLPISMRELRSAGDGRFSLDWRTLEDFEFSQHSLTELALEAPTANSWWRDQASQAALIVLELDGLAYQRQLATAQAAVERAAQQQHHAPTQEQFKQRLDYARSELQREQEKASRLFVVDAGRNQPALRQRYPDPSRYAIVPGRVSYRRCANEPKCAQVDTITLGYFYLPESLKGKHLSYPFETKLHLNVGQALQAWLSAEKTSH